MSDSLYLSFDGMTDPLGRSQVLPYLTGLAALGHRIRIVSLEKAGKDRAAVAAICADAGIEWHPLDYRDRPPILSTFLNLRALRRGAERLLRERPADFVHCRSDLPGIVGLRLRQSFGLPMLYDMRAFWPDERAEGGAWPQANPLWRTVFGYFKRRQRELLAQAEELVVLSEDGKRAVAEMRVRDPALPVTVIPCCADFGLFKPSSPAERQAARADLGVPADAPLLVHVGSFGPNALLDEMLDFFAVYLARHPAAHFLFIAPSGEAQVRARAAERGVGEAVHVRSASREDVPHWLAAADIGIMFVRPVWSKRAASPTKLGEMLAVGLPVIANGGVGDVADVLERSSAGVAVTRFDPAAYADAIGRIERLGRSAEEIRGQGKLWFDLSVGIRLYDQIYDRLGSASG